MVNYKLTYFDVRGYAEISRELFALAGQKFEDVRFSHAEWPAYKEKLNLPFGQVPLLEVDGKSLGQSHAIARYLARQFGFAGKNAFDEAQVDSITDQIKDYINEVRPHFRVVFGMVEGDEKKLRKEVLEPAVEKNYTAFTKFLKNAKSGFLVGDSVTWADVLLAQNTADLLTRAPELLDAFPEAKAHQQKVHSLPKLKAYLENRPVTKY